MAHRVLRLIGLLLVPACAGGSMAADEGRGTGVVSAPGSADPGAATADDVTAPPAPSPDPSDSATSGMATPPSGVAGMTGAAGMGGLQAGGEVPADPDPSGAEDRTVDDFVCPGGTIAQGMNTFMVGNRARSFYVELPADMSGPIGLVFSWHGFNDAGSDGDAAGWRNVDEVDANADPANPVAVVTPFDIEFEIPIGLDWQFDKPTAAENVDLAFFEAMVGCFDAQYDLDPARIYSYGFSAGSVMSSLIHSAYPKVVSAIVCVSGMWFNDQAEVDMINLIPVAGTWPVLHAQDGGAVLLTHGGPTDITVLNVANLENMAQAAFPFLKANGRVVVDCPHSGGHVLHPELSTAQVMRFFAEHRTGEPSPYRSGELSGYPAGCILRLP